MLDLMIAAALLQARPAAPQTPDPCHAGPPEAAPAACPRWRQIQLVRAITDASGYVDPASARRDGNKVDMDTLTVLRTPIGGNVARFVARVRLDCTARTTLVLNLIGYDAAGAKLYEGPAEAAPPEPAPAGSPRAIMLDEFCAR